MSNYKQPTGIHRFNNAGIAIQFLRSGANRSVRVYSTEFDSNSKPKPAIINANDNTFLTRADLLYHGKLSNNVPLLSVAKENNETMYCIGDGVGSDDCSGVFNKFAVELSDYFNASVNLDRNPDTLPSVLYLPSRDEYDLMRTSFSMRYQAAEREAASFDAIMLIGGSTENGDRYCVDGKGYTAVSEDELISRGFVIPGLVARL